MAYFWGFLFVYVQKRYRFGIRPSIVILNDTVGKQWCPHVSCRMRPGGECVDIASPVKLERRGVSCAGRGRSSSTMWIPSSILYPSPVPCLARQITSSGALRGFPFPTIRDAGSLIVTGRGIGETTTHSVIRMSIQQTKLNLDRKRI